MRSSLANSISHTLTNQKPQKIVEHNLKDIERHVSTFYADPRCSMHCECEMCKENYEIKHQGKQILKNSSSMIKIETERVRQFYTFMSSLNKKVSFRMDIPTLCFFEKGDCKVLYKSKNEYIIQQQAAQFSRKNIANFFVEANKKVKDNINVFGLRQNHIRHFKQVVPSYIHGTTEEVEEMKKPKSYLFHKNHKLESDSTEVKQINTSDEVAIVKYLDKGFELLNEKQLRHLLKSPSNTVNIDYIQSYIKPNNEESELFYCDYDGYRAPKNPLMWTRSEIHVKLEVNLLNKYSKDYIPMESLDSYCEVLREITEDYLLYQTYKIIHYLEIIRDLKVTKLTTVWVKDQFKEICFFGLMEFMYEKKEAVDADVSSDVEELRELLDKPYSQLEVDLLGKWEEIKGKKLQELEERQRIKLEQELEKRTSQKQL